MRIAKYCYLIPHVVNVLRCKARCSHVTLPEAERLHHHGLSRLNEERILTSLEPGAIASHFTLLGLDGCEYSVPGSADGRPLLLLFFRSGCPTCDLAFPYFNRLLESYPEGWGLWAVSQDSPERSAAYAQRLSLRCPVLIDAPSLEVSRLYDPPSTPTAYLVGSDGRVDFVAEGFAKSDLNELSERLASLLRVDPVVVAAPDDGNPDMKPGCMARQRFPFRR